MYELFYGNGGHGGPYHDLVEAEERANALLNGSPTERVIYIVPYPYEGHRDARTAAVKTITKQPKKYPALDAAARIIADEVLTIISKTAEATVQPEMPYKAQYLLEEVIKKLKDRV